MPEGHTVHRSARDLRVLAGAPVSVSSPQGRFPEAAAVDGDVLASAEAYGKHLLVGFASDSVVHVHLGMRGVWLRYPAEAARALLTSSQVAPMAWAANRSYTGSAVL